MGKIFDEIKQGLNEMSDFLEGKSPVSVRVVRKGLKVAKLNSFSPSKIKNLRLSLGLSQSQFAEIIGVKTLTVAKWEQGINPPNGASLRLLYILSKRPKVLEETNLISFG